MPIVSDGSDPLGVTSFATHQLPLEQAPDGYDMFRNKADGLHQGGSAALAGGVAWQAAGRVRRLFLLGVMMARSGGFGRRVASG
jgi:hypothetical protein